MNQYEYFFGAPEWQIPAIAIAAVMMVLLVRNFLKSRFGYWQLVSLGLKVVGVGVLLVCLMEPRGRGLKPKPQANLLPILVDNSQSMSVRQSGAQLSDAEQIKQTLDPTQKWLVDVEQAFDVRRYQFDSNVVRQDDFGSLEFDGTASILRTSLASISDRYRGRPLAGCLLFTDGNATDLLRETRWSELGFAVFPVYRREGAAIKDIRIANVAVSQSDFETAPITIDGAFVSNQLFNVPVTVRLIDESEKVVREQTITFTEAAPEQSVRLRIRPEKAGVSFYRLQAFLQSESDTFLSGQSVGEATLLNNSRWIAVNQRRGPYDVLYVAGRPNWEYKYLRRSIDEDAEVRLLGLLRIAKKQPKFSFQDNKVGSNANPLFAGLGGSEEEAAEQLDEPVILRLGVKDASELAGGFPKLAEELFPFSAIILDDIEASYFSQDQLLLLRQFVSARGGALLFLGGEDSMERGGYGETPLGELSPVYLPRGRTEMRNNEDLYRGPYRMRLTREGLLQPYLRLRDTEGAELERLASAPPLQILNHVTRIKPGAVTLAVALNEAGDSQPAMVTQPFGRGKTSALMLGDLWRWSLRRGVGDELNKETFQSAIASESNDPAQFWRQIVRWLVSDVERNIEAQIETSETPGMLKIVTRVKDEKFLARENAVVSIDVKSPNAESLTLNAVPDVQQAGVYVSEFWPQETGGYRFHVSVTSDDGIPCGETEIGWAHDPAGEEFRNLGTNVQLLDDLARQTGGKSIDPDAIDDWLRELESRPALVTEAWEFAVWHNPWVIMIAIACLCGEWGIRRWRGLP